MNIVFLTGAGISAESGLPTFRGEGGWWRGHAATDLATPEAFRRHPELVHQFYNFRRQMLQSNEIKPNPAHEALADLEHRWTAGNFLLITQNVGNLHQRAGSHQVVPIHGELTKARCLDTGEVFPWTQNLSTSTEHPQNDRPAGRLRPHIVWFGETPLQLPYLEKQVAAADLFVAVGTSGIVWPAAGLARGTRPECRRVLLNLAPPDNQAFFQEFVRGPASSTVPDFCQSLLSSTP